MIGVDAIDRFPIASAMANIASSYQKLIYQWATEVGIDPTMESRSPIALCRPNPTLILIGDKPVDYFLKGWLMRPVVGIWLLLIKAMEKCRFDPLPDSREPFRQGLIELGMITDIANPNEVARVGRPAARQRDVMWSISLTFRSPQ
jgi:hypothetical protein